jgi:hypothetical protein
VGRRDRPYRIGPRSSTDTDVMLNSPTGPHSESTDRSVRSSPGQSALRVYRVFESSVRRLLKIPDDPAAVPGPTAAGHAQSALGGAVTSVARILHRSGDRAGPDDAQVREWKAAWLTGAESCWAGRSLLANPHKPPSHRAAAWRAGWHWAELQPDRRQPAMVRFAHPYRRRTDRPSRLVRSAQAGAVGLSVLTIAGWVWHMQRQRTRSGRRTGISDESPRA